MLVHKTALQIGSALPGVCWLFLTFRYIKLYAETYDGKPTYVGMQLCVASGWFSQIHRHYIWTQNIHLHPNQQMIRATRSKSPYNHAHKHMATCNQIQRCQTLTQFCSQWHIDSYTATVTHDAHSYFIGCLFFRSKPSTHNLNQSIPSLITQSHPRAKPMEPTFLPLLAHAAFTQAHSRSQKRHATIEGHVISHTAFCPPVTPLCTYDDE